VRIKVADWEEARTHIQQNTRDGRLFLALAKPPPPGSEVRFEVATQSSGERVLAARCVVESQVLDGSQDAHPGALVKVAFVEPGCDEEVRRALKPVMAPRQPPPPRRKHDTVIGIDLGTTYTCVATMEGTGPKVIASRLGHDTIPSAFTFDERGLPVVGQSAERRNAVDPARGVVGTKRFIGRRWSDDLKKELAGKVHAHVAPDSEGMAAALVAGRVLSPVEVAACILAEVRQSAETSLGRPVRHAVVTVPAYFSEVQRNAVREAGERAGVDILRIVNEPTAASIMFGHRRNEQKTILVYDFGGGTFDVSVLEVSGSLYMVKATGGDAFLGGLDVDRIIAEHLEAELASRLGHGDLDRVAQDRLLAAARDLKHELSGASRAAVSIPRLRTGASASDILDFTVEVTREKLDQLVGPLVDRTLAICDEALTAAGLLPADVNDVLLVGGQTRMPIVSQRLRAHFGRPPSKRVNPDEVVALGAALVAASRDEANAPTLIDVLGVPIWVSQDKGPLKPLLAKNVSLPASTSVTLQGRAGQPLHLSVHQGHAPDASHAEILGSSTVKVPDGVTDARVTFSFALDNECVLKVTAKVMATGEEKVVTLTTQQTADGALAQMHGERVAVNVAPASSSGAQAGPGRTVTQVRTVVGTRPPAARRTGWVWAVTGITLALATAYLLAWPVDAETRGWRPPPSPGLTGAYAPNRALALPQVLDGKAGPSAGVAVDGAGHTVAGLADGRITKRTLDDAAATEVGHTGGRPLGVAVGADGSVLVADARLGLLSVRGKGEVALLATQVGGVKVGLAAGVAVTGEGTVLFTDATARRGLDDLAREVVEHVPSGRLVAYVPAEQAARVVLGGLALPLGVAVAPDGTYAVVAESLKYRLLRVWLSGDKAGRHEVLLDGLPGFPAGVSYAPARRAFWVALAAPRVELLDRLADLPWLRRAAFRVPESIWPEAARHALVLAVSPQGAVLHVLHDGSPTSFAPVTSVVEHDGNLYLGSWRRDGVAVVPAPPVPADAAPDVRPGGAAPRPDGENQEGEAPGGGGGPG
jgi:molecular chaperone DnaK